MREREGSLFLDEAKEPDPWNDALRAARVRQLYTQGGTGLIGAFVGAVILAFALWDVVSHVRLIIWLCLSASVHVPRHLLRSAYYRSEPKDTDAGRWVRCFP